MPKKPAAAAVVKSEPVVAQPSATIVRRIPRLTALQKAVQERKAKGQNLAGEYRVIHGRISVPRPREAYMLPNGTENPNEPKQEDAFEGDVIVLGDEDALRLIEAGLVESTSVPEGSPNSRVGKVFDPNIEHMTPKQNRSGRAA